MAGTTHKLSKKSANWGELYSRPLAGFGLSIGSLVISYFLLLWAFETGSLLVYLAVFVMLGVAIKLLVVSLKSLFSRSH